MTHAAHQPMNVDGRQTGGRKGFAYDWRRVLLEGVDGGEEPSISDDDLVSLLASAPA